MPRLLVFLATLLIQIPNMAVDATSGTVNGQIALNGKPVTLTHAYAWREPSRVTKETVTVVLLTDRGLDDHALADRTVRMNLSSKGQLAGAEVTIAPMGYVETGEIYFLKGSVTNADQKWEKKFQTESSIEGRLSIREGRIGDITYSYSATFKAPIGSRSKK